MFFNFNDYILLFLYSFFVVIIGIIIYLLSYYTVQKSSDFEKLSTYECGFEPFGDTRNVFDVKFYLVAILFVIFDSEVLFILPWVLVVNSLSYFGFFSMFLFVFILGLIFIYEWLIGALDWS